jgi:hypothetical protein
MLRYIGLMATALLVGAPALGQTVTWSGEIRCTSGGSLGALRAPFKVTVTGNQARYERPIYNPQNNAQLVGNETGGGAVAADGTVKLTGDYSSATSTLKGSYEGKLSRPQAVLTGTVSTFNARNRSGVDRVCRIELTPG